MAAVLGRVVNTTHSGTTLSTLAEIPDLSYTFQRNEIGSASWSVPFTHPQLQRVSSTGPTGFGPKLTDFRIGVSSTGNNGTWETVFGGICGPVGLQSGRSTVAVSGVDYLAWLDQPFRFNGYLSNLKTEADVASYRVNKTQMVSIDAMVANLWDAGNPSESLQITTSYLPNAGAWSANIVAHIVILGDNTTVLGHIKAIGALNDPYGFEFWMNYDKTLVLYAPRRVSYNGAVTTQIFAPSIGSPITDMKWGNAGPIATTTIGEYNGFYRNSRYLNSRLVYRDWWQRVAYDNINLIIKNFPKGLDAATDAQGTHDRNPQHQLTLSFRPEDVPTGFDALFWFRNQLGKIVEVDSEDWFLPYHRIDGKFWIDKQTLTNDNVGNWTCELGLEQIYPTDATPP